MSKKKTQEEFIADAIKVHGNKYDYSKVEYINDRSKICVICPYHGEFWITPNNLLSGKGCKNCSHRSFKYDTNEFIKCAREIHGDKYDYSKVEYVNNHTKVCIICPIHGEFWQMPNSHLKGCGCKKCAQIIIGNYTRNSKEQFIEKAKKVHGNKYDYSKVEYVNAHTKVCIICLDHGEFWQTPHKHINTKRGCSKCGGSDRITTDEFIKKAIKIHGNKYDYSKVEYINSNTKICIICPDHGEFWQTPHNHLLLEGCPQCNNSKLENEVKTLLQNNKIEFEEQKRFDWLGKQSLDFYLPRYNLAIECQGIQHFEPIEYFGGVKTLENQIKRDKRKYLLCENNSIEILYYSTLKKYCEINTLEKLIEEILKHGKVHCTTE